MTKATNPDQPAERPVPPRTINLALAAVCGQVVFAVIYAALLWPFGDKLQRAVISANADKAKPNPLCDAHPGTGCLDAAKTVHSFQIQTAIGTLLVAAAIVFIALRVLKGIRSGRTMYIIVSAMGAFVGFVGSPLAITAAFSSGPVVPRIVTTLAAASAVAALVFLFLPESGRYFGQASPRPRASDARPGLGSLFRPRPPAQRPPPVPGLRPSAASRAKAPDTGAGSGSRSKVRTQEAAVARGAELARSRAKASKSRRSEL
jgi:hypothetical protein